MKLFFCFSIVFLSVMLQYHTYAQGKRFLEIKDSILLIINNLDDSIDSKSSVITHVKRNGLVIKSKYFKYGNVIKETKVKTNKKNATEFQVVRCYWPDLGVKKGVQYFFKGKYIAQYSTLNQELLHARVIDISDTAINVYEFYKRLYIKRKKYIRTPESLVYPSNPYFYKPSKTDYFYYQN